MAPQLSRAPGPDNDWHAAHVACLLASYQALTGRELVPTGSSARSVFEAPFALLSHGSEPDPLFNYANRTALDLFELDWAALIRTPSRASAEPLAQAAREQLMQRVRSQGYIDDYRGVRIAASGRRFTIEAACVWNVTDTAGAFIGQAAHFAVWHPLAG